MEQPEISGYKVIQNPIKVELLTASNDRLVPKLRLQVLCNSCYPVWCLSRFLGFVYTAQFWILMLVSDILKKCLSDSAVSARKSTVANCQRYIPFLSFHLTNFTL
jgi:hypothetical protein